MNKKREILAILLAGLLFFTCSWGLGRVLIPLREQYGCDWAHYLQEDKGSVDVLFLGSSLVYCDVIPAVLREESGLSSYVMAGPEQTIPISYYYAQEAFQTQSPQLVVQEVTGMFFSQYTNYTKANIDYMPLGLPRLKATMLAAESSAIPGLLLPLASYHHRWKDIPFSEVRTHLFPDQGITAGYTLLTDSCAPPADRERDYTADSDNYRRNLTYLEKLRDLCRQEGAQLLLYIAPAAGKIPPAALATLTDAVNAMGLTLENFNDCLPQLGLDPAKDWYDPLHFNLYGAEKFSRWLGGYLSGLDLTPGAADEDLWARRSDYIRQALEN